MKEVIQSSNNKPKNGSYSTNKYMQVTLELAKEAFENNEVPVGAIIVDKKGNIISKARNMCENYNNPLLHAEIIAITQALEALNQKYLSDCDIYVSLEPCPMCASAIGLTRIKRIYFGAYDTKSGGIENGPRIFSSGSIHHNPEIYGGIMENEASILMRKFFKELRGI